MHIDEVYIRKFVFIALQNPSSPKDIEFFETLITQKKMTDNQSQLFVARASGRKARMCYQFFVSIALFNFHTRMKHKKQIIYEMFIQEFFNLLIIRLKIVLI